jgi:hypothetical protein
MGIQNILYQKGGVFVVAMWIVWLLAIYGFCTIFVLLLQKWNGYHTPIQVLSIKLLLYNSESSLEGVVRSFAELSSLSGQSLFIHAYDFGSDDLTVNILTKLAQECPHLIQEVHYNAALDSLNDQVSTEKESWVVIDLRQKV